MNKDVFPPCIEHRRSVLVVPYQRPWLGGPDHASIPDHGRIRYSGKFKDSFPEERHPDPTKFNGKFLYGGPMKHHFGHALVDSIIRLWAFSRGSYDGVVFPALDKGKIPDWFLRLASFFGVKESDILVIENPSIFEHMTFAEPGSTLGSGPSQWYLNILGDLYDGRRVDAPEDIFLGRTHVISSGTLMGESYFANRLDRAGFSYIKPEKFDIIDQVSMMANAKRIVFTEGSSIYSVELLRSLKAKTFMIPRRNGGSSLFSQHLLPRAKSFKVLGDEGEILRLQNRRGHNHPNSPSYSTKPESIHFSMVRNRLISPSWFNEGDFLEHESMDARKYFENREHVADQHINHVNSVRLSFSARIKGRLSWRPRP